MSRRKMFLQEVTWEEKAVKEVADEVLKIFENNCPGPSKFIFIYNEYVHLFDGTTTSRVNDFIEDSGNIRVCILVEETFI